MFSRVVVMCLRFYCLVAILRKKGPTMQSSGDILQAFCNQYVLILLLWVLRVVRGSQWNTWISEAKTGVTSWESWVQIGNSMTGGSGCVENQPTKDVEIKSPPCDSNHLVASLL
jgi:hypothetical protein